MQCRLVTAVCLWALFMFSHGPSVMGIPRTVDIVRSYGYDAEELSVVTEDGYILVLTHIRPLTTRRPVKLPVLMIHGVIAASDQWVTKGPGQDLALILVDEGHDVWLGDERGNCFSRHHVSLNTSQRQFWDFSFHESGLYDLPAFIDTVLRRSGSSQLYYVGHSMGTSVFYVMCSLRPEYNRVIRTAVHLAPVAFGLRKQFTPSLQLMIDNAYNIAVALRKQNIHEFLPRTARNQQLMGDVCTERNKAMCIFIVSQLYGPETHVANATKLSSYLKTQQSGTSIKTVLHLTQIYKSKNFAQFNYGKKLNIKRYNAKVPPEYPLTRVTCPLALYYSNIDTFVDEASMARLTRLLPNVVTATAIPRYNHIDFLFADDAPTTLFKNIVRLMSKQ